MDLLRNFKINSSTQEYEGIGKIDDGKRDKALLKAKSIIGKFFLSFSFSRNLRKMFWSPQRDDDYLSIFNGLRVFSMGYIILGHVHESLPTLPLTNLFEIRDIISTYYGSFVMGAFYAVDIFFYMSAFLGTYLMITKFEGKSIPFHMIYFHRLFRILPTLGLFLGILLTFYGLIHSGPFFEIPYFEIVEPCQEYWWTVMLFINNYYPTEIGGNCMNILWYLANDMLFFAFLPFVILAYVKRKTMGYILAIFLIVASMVNAFIISQVENHPITIIVDPNVRNIYHRPYTRFGAYYVGSLFGMFYFEWMKAEKNEKYRYLPGARFYNIFKNSKIMRSISSILAAGVMLFLIFIVYTEVEDMTRIVWDQWLANIFNSFHRVVFVLALTLFFAGSIVGKGGPIRYIFGAQVWGSWAKITFVVYLIHTLVISWIFSSLRIGMIMTKRVAIFYTFSSFILSFLIAVPVALLIESPILQLEKLVIFPPKQRHQIKEKILPDKSEISQTLAINRSISSDE